MIAPRIKDIGIYCAATGVAIAVFIILLVNQFEMIGTIYQNPWLMPLLGIPILRGGTPLLHTINAAILMWPAFLCWFFIVRRSSRKPSPLRTVVSFVGAVVVAHLLMGLAQHGGCLRHEVDTTEDDVLGLGIRRTA